MSSLTLCATTIASGTLTNARRNEGQTVSSFPPSRDPTISHVNSFFFKKERKWKYWNRRSAKHGCWLIAKAEGISIFSSIAFIGREYSLMNDSWNGQRKIQEKGLAVLVYVLKVATSELILCMDCSIVTAKLVERQAVRESQCYGRYGNEYRALSLFPWVL